MKKEDVEELLRGHYRSEVARARQSFSVGMHEERTGTVDQRAPGEIPPHEVTRLEWRQYLAAAAALVALPVLLLFSQPTVGPLAGLIDQEWSRGGRVTVTKALLEVRETLQIQRAGTRLSGRNEEESR